MTTFSLQQELYLGSFCLFVLCFVFVFFFMAQARKRVPLQIKAKCAIKNRWEMGKDCRRNYIKYQYHLQNPAKLSFSPHEPLIHCSTMRSQCWKELYPFFTFLSVILFFHLPFTILQACPAASSNFFSGPIEVFGLGLREPTLRSQACPDNPRPICTCSAGKRSEAIKAS